MFASSVNKVLRPRHPLDDTTGLYRFPEFVKGFGILCLGSLVLYFMCIMIHQICTREGILCGQDFKEFLGSLCLGAFSFVLYVDNSASGFYGRFTCRPNFRYS